MIEEYILKEELKVSDFAIELSDEIYKELSSKITLPEIGKMVLRDFHYTYLDNKNKTYNLLIRDLNIHYDINDEYDSYSGQFNKSNDTSWAIDDDVDILIGFNITIKSSTRLLKEVLIHETEHFFEFIMKTLNTFNKPKKTSNTSHIYRISNNYLNSDNPILSQFSKAIYYGDKSENNSFVSQVYNFIRSITIDKGIEWVDINKLHRSVLETNYYNTLINIKNNILKWDVNSIDYKNTQKVLKDYDIELGDIQKYTLNRINKSIELYRNTIPKIITRAIRDFNLNYKNREMRKESKFFTNNDNLEHLPKREFVHVNKICPIGESHNDKTEKKTIIINENQLKVIENEILNEQTQIQLVQKIENYLNQHFERGSQTQITPDGSFQNKKVIGVKAIGDGEEVIVNNISPQDLFFKLETLFKDDIKKGEKRDTFIKQVIIDWFNKSIVNGNLSKNLALERMIGSMVQCTYDKHPMIEEVMKRRKTHSWFDSVEKYYEQKYMYEGLTTTYSVEQTIRMLQSQGLKMGDDFKVEDYSGSSTFHIELDRIEETNQAFVDTLITFMDNYGWYVGIDRSCEDLIDIEFRAKFDKEVSLGDEKGPFFHISPLIYHDKIMRMGLAPKSGNKKIEHPERIFLLTNQNELFNLMRQLHRASRVVDGHGEKRGKYVVYKIDDELFSAETRLFVDPDYPYGVYTQESIHPRYLKAMGVYSVDRGGNIKEI